MAFCESFMWIHASPKSPGQRKSTNTRFVKLCEAPPDVSLRLCALKLVPKMQRAHLTDMQTDVGALGLPLDGTALRGEQSQPRLLFTPVAPCLLHCPLARVHGEIQPAQGRAPSFCGFASRGEAPRPQD